jgi:cytochrome c oxidase subunit 3
MSAHAATTNVKNVWSGGIEPYKASYGKLMMWFFLLSDAFSFSGLLITYGALRFSNTYWPDPDQVFASFPGFGHMHLPLMFVSLMTFILIMSSVTMVLAVEAGSRMDRAAVEKWMLWTILGGIAFLSCQAWEWTHLIHDNTTIFGNLWGPLAADGSRTPGPVNFGQLFFFITGFHGTHVLSGVVINIIIYMNVVTGTYDRRGHYEMVEKVGLYWHFVDLVWVFVFTFFYLI